MMKNGMVCFERCQKQESRVGNKILTDKIQKLSSNTDFLGTGHLSNDKGLIV